MMTRTEGGGFDKLSPNGCCLSVRGENAHGLEKHLRLSPHPFGLSLSKPRSSCLLCIMGFWAYMLHCADRSFYVGHTDDLEKRIAAHQHGHIAGYTSTRLPVKLVWSEEFPTRYEALQAERRIKGWSRAKKLALTRGDWELISALARNREERASTNSARTDAVGTARQKTSAEARAKRRSSTELP